MMYLRSLEAKYIFSQRTFQPGKADTWALVVHLNNLDYSSVPSFKQMPGK